MKFRCDFPDAGEREAFAWSAFVESPNQKTIFSRPSPQFFGICLQRWPIEKEQ